MMHTYRLHTPHDHDDSTPDRYTSAKLVQLGEVIQLPETGFWHVITAVEPNAGGTLLTLSQSAQSPQEAQLVAQQTARR